MSQPPSNSTLPFPRLFPTYSTGTTPSHPYPSYQGQLPSDSPSPPFLHLYLAKVSVLPEQPNFC